MAFVGVFEPLRDPTEFRSVWMGFRGSGVQAFRGSGSGGSEVRLRLDISGRRAVRQGWRPTSGIPNPRILQPLNLLICRRCGENWVSRADLVVLPEASTFLAADAVRGEMLYCDDEDRQAREELYYLRRAADLAPYQKERLEALLDGELRR
jgi:hypothetical protein